MKRIITSLVLITATFMVLAQEHTETKYITTESGRLTRRDYTYDEQGRPTSNTLSCWIDELDDYRPVIRRLFRYDEGKRTMEYQTWNPWKRCFQPVELVVYDEGSDSAHVECYRWQKRRQEWKRQRP